MKKPILILVVLIIALAAAYAYLPDNSDNNTGQVSNGNEENPGGQAAGQPEGGAAEREVKGTVVSVDNSQVPADGPSLVTVREEDGAQTVVAVRSMGINFCPAQASIAAVYEIEAGDRVEARGAVGEGGTVLPCESASHYLRVVER